jgi:hypothetical protein
VKVTPLSGGDVSFALVPDHGFVEVLVHPSGARVSFLVGGRLEDGESRRVEAPAGGAPAGEEGAPAPRRYRLPKGAHGVELAAPHHATWRGTLFVTPDHVQRVEQTLARAIGFLSVHSMLKGVAMKATLRREDGTVEKRLSFQVPWNDIPLETGRWYLEFEKEGYTKFMSFFEVREGEKKRIAISLMKKR